MGNKLREQDKRGLCRAGKLLYLVSNNVLLGDTGHNALIYFKYVIGTHIKNECNDYKITGIFIKKDKYSNRKYYNIHCNKCGWDGYMSEDAIDNNYQCQCCSKEVVVPGINDIATTDSWALEYFADKENAYKYHNSSIARVDLKCPICGQVYKDVCLKSFFKNIYHLNCPCSKAYASYPERLVYNIFKDLNIDNVIPQASTKELKWAGKVRYDFYIPNKSCIIETHGIQHYQDSFVKVGGKTCAQEQENDLEKEMLAKANNIKHYIVIDCRNSSVNWIKSSILNSELPELLSFSEKDINWELCDKKSRSELLVDVCRTYTEDITATKQSLAEQFGLKPDTIRKYLIQGKTLSLCDFDSSSIREKLSNGLINSMLFIYKDGVLIQSCTSVIDICKKSIDIFGKKKSDKAIYNALNNNHEINGCVIVRDKSINSYVKYVDFLCDPDNYYLLK